MSSITDLFAQAPQAQHKGVKSQSFYLTMRDGNSIAVDLMLPADLPEGTRIPAILIMARYWRSFELRVPDPPNRPLIGPREDVPAHLLGCGFAVLLVDGRGSGASMGTSRYPWSPEELADYAEVATWAEQQAWCNGHLGAFGISYEGATAQRLAASGVKGVKAIIPQEIEYDVFTDVALPGGVFNKAFIEEWNTSNGLLDRNKMSSLFPWSARLLVKGVRPVDADRKTRTALQKALRDHEQNTNVFEAIASVTYRDDPFGATGVTLDDFSLFDHQMAIEQSGVALFSWGSWLDATTAESVLRNYNTLRNAQIGVIGAWKHEMSADGSPFQAPKGKPNPLLTQQWAAMAQFFEQTLKQDHAPQGKRLFYYTLGEEAWKETTVFPLPNTQMQTWYFQAENGLAAHKPTATAGADSYTVDMNATTGKTNRWHTQMAKPLVYPDRSREDRRLLTYTSAPLPQDIEITGYPVVSVFVSSTMEDGAFFAYLEDVDEKGVVRYITEGQLRGVHRSLADAPAPYWTGMPYRTFRRADAAPLPKGETVELTFGLLPTSVLIRRGHRIRLALAGADKDTFAPIATAETPQWAVQRHALAASCLQLPVIPR